jgi:hypothetical protein
MECAVYDDLTISGLKNLIRQHFLNSGVKFELDPLVFVELVEMCKRGLDQ